MARVAVVTGGTRGIGEAISIMLDKAGYKVAATYQGNEVRAQEFNQRTGIKTFKFDVCDFAATQAGIKEIETALGPIDVVVNNAGITRDGTLQRMSWENWNEVINTNLSSCFNMCRAVIDGITTRYGHLSGFAVTPGQQVHRGDTIGYVGLSGRSTGPHLHYEVRINDTPVNPHKYLRLTFAHSGGFSAGS